MIVELISVGTELLLGNIVNTNAQYLSETCAKLGLNVYYQTTVGDNRERMTEVFRTALSRADLVIIGGGLGPTEDDITGTGSASAPIFRIATGVRRWCRRARWYFPTQTAQLRDLPWRKTVRPRFFFRDRRTNCIRWWKIRFVLIFRNDLTV